MKRILVTGASGFIGRHTLPILLARGFEVHAVALNHDLPAIHGLRRHRADLLDSVAVARLVADVMPTHLMHLAWYAVPGKYQSAEVNYLWRDAGVVLLEAFTRAGGIRAVFAGSCFEYDLTLPYCSETLTRCDPATVYGQCKLALAQLVTGRQPEGLSTAWARIFWLYGPHEAPSRLVPSVILPLMRGERARCTHGRQIRDFLHVEDVAGAFVALLESPVRGIVNIASGDPVTIRFLVSTLAALLDARDRIDFGALEAPPEDPDAVIADTGILHKSVGWTPRWRLEDGLAATIQWWRDHGAVAAAG
jgi:nucleoside-diphosphate-sugar epimerase